VTRRGGGTRLVPGAGLTTARSDSWFSFTERTVVLAGIYLVLGAAVEACWVSRCSGTMTGCPACTPSSVMIGVSSWPKAWKAPAEAQISKVCRFPSVP